MSLPLPKPDYANVDAEPLYTAEQMQSHRSKQFKEKNHDTRTCNENA